MLDYQINESIAKAYLNRVCRRRMNEGVNDVETVSTPLTPDMKDNEDFLSTANDYFTDPEGYERRREEEERKGEIERRERLAQRREEERRRQEEYERNVPRLVASDHPPLKTQATIKADTRYIPPYMSRDPNEQSKEAGVRIGKGAYQGLAYALPYTLVGRTTAPLKAAGQLEEINKLKKQMQLQTQLLQKMQKGDGMGLNPKQLIAGGLIGAGGRYAENELENSNLNDKEFLGLPPSKWLKVATTLGGIPAGFAGYILGDEIADNYIEKRTCPECGFVANDEYALKRHFISEHGNKDKK